MVPWRYKRVASRRTIRCEICNIVVNCKHFGRPKKCCNSCTHQKNYDAAIIYRKKNRKKILRKVQKYRETNRENIRIKDRERNLIITRARKRHDKKLLADVLANPRKYLNRVGGKK